MSKYTTGEIAKLCNVSVRTVQYYDTRQILVPSALSEGGRRLYSKEDLNKLKIICFLRELNLPIDSIKKLLNEEYPERVISILLDEQEARLRTELAEKQKSLDAISGVKKALAQLPHFSVESIQDIARIMENKKKLHRLRIYLVIMGLILDAMEISTLMLWIFKGIWWPFALAMAVVIGFGVCIAALYYRRTVYICPQCHSVFRPVFREFLFSRHTPNTRRLTCTACGHFGFCVETYGKEI